MFLVAIVLKCSWTNKINEKAEIKENRVAAKSLLSIVSNIESPKTNKKAKKPKKKKVMNSIGRTVEVVDPKEMTVTKFPFYLTRCDQIIKTPAEFIPDMGDYRNRETGYFTLTSAYFNLYKDPKYNLLFRSIHVSQTKEFPRHIRGTKSCILLKSPPKGDKDITLCLPNKQHELKMLSALLFFRECARVENDTKKINMLALMMLLRKCAGGRILTPRQLLRELEKRNKPKTPITQPPVIRMKPYFHPGSDRLPGTPPKRQKAVKKN